VASEATVIFVGFFAQDERPAEAKTTSAAISRNAVAEDHDLFICRSLILISRCTSEIVNHTSLR
jgi:hypothetical protein